MGIIIIMDISIIIIMGEHYKNFGSISYKMGLDFWLLMVNYNLAVKHSIDSIG
jgi:hypothetical protein